LWISCFNTSQLRKFSVVIASYFVLVIEHLTLLFLVSSVQATTAYDFHTATPYPGDENRETHVQA
jgi:hypothetical protein